MRRLPVVQQVVDHRVEALGGRVPRLEQVVVQTDVVDGLDGHVGVGVRGQQQQLRVRRVDPGGGEQLGPGHPRHPLIGGDQRDRLVPQRQPGQHVQRLGTGRDPDDAVVAAVLIGQVAADRRRHRGVVVDGEDDRSGHGGSSLRPTREGPTPGWATLSGRLLGSIAAEPLPWLG